MSSPIASVSAPPSPQLEGVTSTVDSYPSHDADLTSHLPADAPNDDIPLHFPPERSPSPELPNLQFVAFPPDEAEESDSDDDEVAHTLPIYMSASLYPQIQLFQYPLNTQTISAGTWARERGKVVTARVKESVGRVEVEVPVNMDVSVWRDERANDLGYVQDLNGGAAGGVEGGYGFNRGDERSSKDKKKEKKKKEEKKWGDRLRLRSEPVPSTLGTYAGLIHDGALHLHPISKVNQLRTSLAYLDDFDAKPNARRSHNDDDDEDQPAAKKPPVKAATPATQQRILKDDENNDGSGSIKDFRNKMWTMAQKEAEDEWVQYKWNEAGEDESMEKIQALPVPEMKQVRLACSTKGLDYVDKA